jgi:predicted RNase H-like nuclease
MRGGPVASRSALPYEILAGVEPVRGGWLVAPGNLQGITLAPQPAHVLESLADVLDYRPSFAVVALHAPVGAPDEAGEWREADLAARQRLGRRRAAVVRAPSRAVLEAETFEDARLIDPSLDIVQWRSLAKAAEAIREVQSWRQRAVWEVHPELALMQMNDGEPVEYGRRTQHGRKVRRELLVSKLPGAERVLAARPQGVREDKLIDALADLWVARRIIARAITRMAADAKWNDDGVRMDIVC